MAPVGWNGDERNELAGDLIDHHMAGIFPSGFTSYDRSGWNADECDQDGGDDGADRQRKGAYRKDVGGNKPEDDGGDGAVGSGAGLEQSCSEEGADGPRPQGLLFGWRMELNIGVSH